MFIPWDLIPSVALAEEAGLVRGRRNPTVVLCIVGAKMREASSTSPCRSQVTGNLRASFHLCSLPPGCELDPTFLQGCLPRTQDKGTHLPPLPPSLLVEDASSSTGKRQTCDIEGVLWGQWGRGIRGMREVIPGLKIPEGGIRGRS